jgi:hypothetical protein
MNTQRTRSVSMVAAAMAVCQAGFMASLFVRQNPVLGLIGLAALVAMALAAWRFVQLHKGTTLSRRVKIAAFMIALGPAVALDSSFGFHNATAMTDLTSVTGLSNYMSAMASLTLVSFGVAFLFDSYANRLIRNALKVGAFLHLTALVAYLTTSRPHGVAGLVENNWWLILLLFVAHGVIALFLVELKDLTKYEASPTGSPELDSILKIPIDREGDVIATPASTAESPILKSEEDQPPQIQQDDPAHPTTTVDRPEGESEEPCAHPLSEDLIRRLDERFILGEISENTYNELRRKYGLKIGDHEDH